MLIRFCLFYFYIVTPTVFIFLIGRFIYLLTDTNILIQGLCSLLYAFILGLYTCLFYPIYKDYKKPEQQ